MEIDLRKILIAYLGQALSFSILASLFLLQVANATNIVINNMDSPGEGLNDITPANPVGGNLGSTVGEQRFNVYQFAAAMMETIIDSPATINIDARFDPLTCSSTSGRLGQAGVGGWSANTCGATLFNTWHPTALLNSLNGLSNLCDDVGDTWPDEDLWPGASDLNMTFNSSLDNNNSCIANRSFYYGLDGNAGTDFDFLSVVLHEIIHGLGVLTRTSLSSGSLVSGWNDAYMVHLEDHSVTKSWQASSMTNSERATSAIDDGDLHWIGSNVDANTGGLSAGVDQGHLQMYAPNSIEGGSSVIHIDTRATPDELMEPVLTGPKDSIGLAKFMLQDIGWFIFPNNAPIFSPLEDLWIADDQTLVVDFILNDNDTDLVSVVLSATSSNTALVAQTGLVLSGSGRNRSLSITPITGTNGTLAIALFANDGANSTEVQFTLTILDEVPPSISIDVPNAGTISYVSMLTLAGTAFDNEDGDLSNQIDWQSSLDGNLGSGATISPALNDGVHTITAEVFDSSLNSVTDDILITIDSMGDADGDGLENQLEILLGTDPNNGDSDGDFSSDFIEVSRDGDPTNYTPGVDTDPNNPDTDGDGTPDGLDSHPLDSELAITVNALPFWAMLVFGCALICSARQRGKGI